MRLATMRLPIIILKSDMVYAFTWLHEILTVIQFIFSDYIK